MTPAATDNPYRVLDEARTVEALVHYGWPDEVRAGGAAASAAVRQAEQAVGRWAAQGLPFRRNGSERLFDFYEVYNFMRRVARERDDPVYMAGPCRTFREAVTGLKTCGPDFSLRLRRVFRLAGSPAGGRVRLRVPLPLDGPDSHPAAVELLEPDPASAEVARAPGRLEVRVATPAGPTDFAVEVGVKLTAAGAAPEVDPARLEPWDRSDPDYALYTNPSEGLIRVTPVVASLAESLCGGAANPWEAVQAFWAFFFDRMWSGRIHHDEVDAADPLGCLVRGGWFDCVMGSSLFAALCRSVGIPARVVNGFTLYRSVPGNHYWVEVLLPPYGWVPLDLSSWDLAFGDRRASEWSEWYLGRLDARMTYQRLPRAVTGPVGVRFPAAWYALTFVRGDGYETSYYALKTGDLLYSDWLRVDPGPRAAPEGVRPVSCR